MPPSAAAKTAEVSIDDQFDVLLTAGIQASLCHDYRAAAESFAAAVAFKPDDPKAKFNLGRVQKQLGE